MDTLSGGELVAEFLLRQNIPQLFTLCGGHISPILVASKARGIRVIDTRHEADAVFAADATARLTGKLGVVAVTAGPGITNSITALQNALMAQSPLVLLGGAAPTLLKGRGALQDIDQLSLMRPNVKWAGAVTKRKEIIPKLTKAFEMALEGTPGPVFLELPVDILYPEELVRSWYIQAKTKGKTMTQKLTNWYIDRHINGLFSGQDIPINVIDRPQPSQSFNVGKIQQLVASSQKPVLLVGSGAITQPENIAELAAAVVSLGIPTYLSGMARGLLGANHPLHFRHRRKAALKSADLVILCGVPCDFRLDYGNHLGRATYVGINRDRTDLYKNRKPNLAIHFDPHTFICEWSRQIKQKTHNWSDWKTELLENEEGRTQEIQGQAQTTGKQGINPLQLFQYLDKKLTDDSIIIADGGDFVGTAAYTLAPRKPLSWLDPGAFGTLGVGGGFALGAKNVHPNAEVFIIYGDGSSAYSLMEMDAFMRHQLPVIAIIGNDASWNQIARDQVDILKDATGTALAHSDYEHVAKAFGADGCRAENMEEFAEALKAARKANAKGQSYVINAILAPSEFRKGSLSM
ncbi:MAG: thiamine pyrophosphate-binding protein [Cyclobacteriaceae bacterium]